MIKTFVVGTEEVDDAESAADEILEKLNLSENQLKNTVGIVACNYEFVLSGAAKKICEALPFDVVGTITNAEAIPGETGTLLFTLMVLTSDDVRFVPRLTPSLTEEPGRQIKETYKEAASGEEGSPALILAFAPFMVENSGDEYVSVFTEVSGGAPCFGTLAIDDTEDFSNCFVIYNGEEHRYRMGMILVYGDINPKFYIANISPGKTVGKEALVTKGEGHVLMEVNGAHVSEYFEDLGLTSASETQYALTSLPFLLDYGDGTPPVAKIFIGLTPEKYAVCGGAMPGGAKLQICVADKDDVFFTTGQALDQALADTSDASGMLIYSCISRYMTLGANILGEMELVNEKVGNKIPFMCAYSGGEMCPTEVTEGKAINRFHNNTFIACVF